MTYSFIREKSFNDSYNDMFFSAFIQQESFSIDTRMTRRNFPRRRGAILRAKYQDNLAS